MEQSSPPMSLPELHIISSQALGYAIFDPITYTLIRVNARTASVLEDLKAGVPISGVAERHKLTAAEVQALVAQVNQIVSERAPVFCPRETEGYLQKLVLNVSNDCNMRCVYCYAQGGSYGKPRELMSVETVRQTVERVFEHYSVNLVMFFGGEPTLNPDAIEACCQGIQDLHNKGSIAQLPRFGMITNGLALSQRMLEIIQRYDLSVTVSLDGPAEINDRLRTTRNSRGSFVYIARNIRRLQELTRNRKPSKIEATYTPFHQKAGFRMSDLVGYFEREFKILDIHIAPVTAEPGSPLYWNPQNQNLDTFRETAVELVNTWLTERPKPLASIFQCLPIIVARRSSRYLCGAGLTVLTVSTTGDLYPCYVLLTDEFRMGNVKDPQVFRTHRFQTIRDRFRDNSKVHVPKCTRCWARGFCHVCFRVPYAENGTINQIPDYVCQMNQASAESALLALSRIQADRESWDKVCKNIAEMMNEFNDARTVSRLRER